MIFFKLIAYSIALVVQQVSFQKYIAKKVKLITSGQNDWHFQ